ncbi:E3 ubiquitin protein ligase PRT1-like protein isoform X1 [Tanacetum coccineum]
MNMTKKSHCPLCRHPYQHFPAICQTLHFLLKKLYPVSYDRRGIQTQDSLVTSEINSVGQSSDQSCKQVTVSDVTCAACKQLFYRPVVLNCGHVYCESCITIPTEGMLTCQVCECRHPSGLPKVCDELDHFLEEQFSSQYALRRNTLQLNQDQAQNKNLINEASTTQVPGPSFPTDEDFLQWQLVHGSKFHPGVGCDMCGLCPIIEKRYQCKDCTEKCGYDLCGDCYNTGSILRGRFNQKHTPTHRLELVKPLIKRHITSRQLAAVSAIAARNQSIPANSSPRLPSTDEDGVSSHSNVLSSATSEDQIDNQPSI